MKKKLWSMALLAGALAACAPAVTLSSDELKSSPVLTGQIWKAELSPDTPNTRTFSKTLMVGAAQRYGKDGFRFDLEKLRTQFTLEEEIFVYSPAGTDPAFLLAIHSFSLIGFNTPMISACIVRTPSTAVGTAQNGLGIWEKSVAAILMHPAVRKYITTGSTEGQQTCTLVRTR